MEGDGKGLVHLGKGELTIFPGEGVGGIRSRLGISSFLEGGILGSSLEEVLVGTVQVAKGLLNRDRGDLTQPGIFFLQAWKHGREIVIGQFLTMVEIGSFAGAKAPIVHVTATSERLRQDAPLFISRVQPILVCSLRFTHCLFALHEFR